MSPEPTVISWMQVLSDVFDDQHHTRAQHRRVAIVALQGFDGGVMRAGNGDQGFTGSHFVALHSLRRGRV